MKSQQNKTNIFIFHGTAGYPDENWFPWLKTQFEAKGFEVVVPQFPTPEGQSFNAWMEVLKPWLSKINGDAILIGHSLGGVFLLKLLETISWPVKLAVTVGTPIGVGFIKNFEQDQNFTGFNFNWEKIKSNSQNFLIYQSDNDPFVSIENGQQLAKNLGIKLSLISGAGHFNAAAGYLKFDNLLENLEPYL